MLEFRVPFKRFQCSNLEEFKEKLKGYAKQIDAQFIKVMFQPRFWDLSLRVLVMKQSFWDIINKRISNPYLIYDRKNDVIIYPLGIDTQKYETYLQHLVRLIQYLKRIESFHDVAHVVTHHLECSVYVLERAYCILEQDEQKWKLFEQTSNLIILLLSDEKMCQSMNYIAKRSKEIYEQIKSHGDDSAKVQVENSC